MVWPWQVDTYFSPASLAALLLLSGCSLLTEEPSQHPDDCFVSPLTEVENSISGAPLIHWHPERYIPTTDCGYENGRITNRLNLTEIHGEREFTRNARLIDLNGDDQRELVTRTMNENRGRALDPKTGETLWVSPDVLPAYHHPQASDLAAGDVTGDGTVEVLILSYDGHVLCIDGRDGSLQWHRRLPYHINNPDLQASLSNITDHPGLELALTVGNDFKWGPRDRPRINLMRNPSVLVLRADGKTAWKAHRYDRTNSRGHKTWVHDVNNDGYAEVFAIGNRKIHAFDRHGEPLFRVPLEYSGHPDQIVFGDWSSENPGDEVIYTDGIRAIGVASSTGQILDYHTVTDSLQGHLQDLIFIPSPDGPRLLAQNIRAPDAKTILYDQELNPLWVAQLGYRASMQTTKLLDWTGDGTPEIATGSITSTNDTQCSLQVMTLDGDPLYWHRWNGFPLCILTDAHADKLLLGVGWNEGSEGRYSLPRGMSTNLIIINTPN
ncbi:hypothetical protein GGP84_001361 [Salinibacter ruber]|uniref:outer membrane protein assembly factor BamB family protein n=1 Tax=Salinibacter ruber TaxID=146919 RepID=UPI002168A662|nr:PQQ-binding-like beta-propeller repeat protein [Salinibacter ruber]MCS3938735.1 hypothetical protein [Salinibacter ruber]